MIGIQKRGTQNSEFSTQNAERGAPNAWLKRFC
jgi:hypothetical protein